MQTPNTPFKLSEAPMLGITIMHIALLLVLYLTCAACSVVHACESTRASRTMFKGVELYSWLDLTSGSWRFVLLPGTNRNKTTAEIVGALEVIGSVPELEEHLSRLAPGEIIFWLVPDPEKFALPPTAILNDIVKHATASGVTIHLLGVR